MKTLILLLALCASAVAQASPQVDGVTGVFSAYTAGPCSTAWTAADFTSTVTAWDPQDARSWEFQMQIEMDANYSCGTMATAWIIITATTNDTPANRAASYSNVTNFFVYSDDVQYLLMVPMTYDNVGTNGHQWHYNYAPTTVPVATTAYRMQAIVVGAGTSMITQAHRISWQ